MYIKFNDVKFERNVLLGCYKYSRTVDFKCCIVSQMKYAAKWTDKYLNLQICVFKAYIIYKYS